MKKIGCVDQIDGGRWRLRIRRNGTQETVEYYDTYEQAEVARRAFEIAIRDSAATSIDEEPGLTMAEYGKTVLTRREVMKKVRDPDSDWSRFEQHIRLDPIGKRSMRAIQPKHGNQWLNRLEDKGLEVQTRRNCLNLARVIMREAVKVGLVKVNPFVGLKVEGKPADAWTYLQPEEQTGLVAATPAPECHIVGVAIGAGFRAGELVTLRLADVHLDDGRPRAVVRYGSAPSGPTKTGAVRSVPLFGVALSAMRAWLAALPKYCKKNPHGLVFPRQRGGFRSEEHVIPWGMWKGMPAKGKRALQVGSLERAGIKRNVRWHDLRHTCASSLVSGWWGRHWSLQEVKEMLGHTSITTTQRYAHMCPGALDQAGLETSGQGAARESAESVTDLDDDEDGAPGQSRTGALSLRKRLLYPLSYGGELGSISKELGKLCFSRLRTGLPPPDSQLTTDFARAVQDRDGERAQALARELAARVLLSDDRARLALEVLAGGPLAITRALELVDTVPAPVAEKAKGTLQ